MPQSINPAQGVNNTQPANQRQTQETQQPRKTQKTQTNTVKLKKNPSTGTGKNINIVA